MEPSPPPGYHLAPEQFEVVSNALDAGVAGITAVGVVVAVSLGTLVVRSFR